jgi:hypothetical protein
MALVSHKGAAVKAAPRLVHELADCYRRLRPRRWRPKHGEGDAPSVGPLVASVASPAGDLRSVIPRFFLLTANVRSATDPTSHGKVAKNESGPGVLPRPSIVAGQWDKAQPASLGKGP